MLTIEPPALRDHARHGFRGAQEKTVEMRGDHRRPIGERDLPDEPDALDAGVVDENVEAPRLSLRSF